MAYIQDWGMRVQAQPQINTTRRAFLHLSQNENGRMLNIRITDVNIPAGSTAVLAGTKPDGTVYSQAGTLAGNTATFAEDVQMTAVAGTWDAKITVTNGGNCICTARITITIDPDTVAGGAIPSDSQLDGIIAECRAIADSVRKEAYGSPLVADAVEDMTDQSRVYVYTGSETGYTSGHWYYYNGTVWADGGVYNAVAVDTDTTLSIAGKAADAKEVGDQLTSVKEELNSIDERVEALETRGDGLTEDIKTALLLLAQKVAYVDAQGQSYYESLYDALYPAEVASISAVYTQSGVVYDDDSLDSLKDDLVVTAHYEDSITKTITGYTLSGTLTVGTSTITVSYGGKTTTFTVTVTDSDIVPVYYKHVSISGNAPGSSDGSIKRTSGESGIYISAVFDAEAVSYKVVDNGQHQVFRFYGVTEDMDVETDAFSRIDVYRIADTTTESNIDSMSEYTIDNSVAQYKIIFVYLRSSGSKEPDIVVTKL